MRNFRSIRATNHSIKSLCNILYQILGVFQSAAHTDQVGADTGISKSLKPSTNFDIIKFYRKRSEMLRTKYPMRNPPAERFLP